MILTDTHSHLYAEQFSEDIEDVMLRCRENNIHRIFLPNIDSTSIEGMKKLVAVYPKTCFPMMGLHPTSVKENYLEELKLVEQLLDQEKFVAIGEIGIDLYWDKTYFKEQQDAFRKQINLAKKYKLPFVIHCRDSFNEIFEILDDMNDDDMKGIFHCFTGTLEQANHIINYGGFKLGIGGVVTFKNSGLDAVVKDIDLQHIVLETDSPYLTPTPFRGKRNESSYLIHIAQKLADIYGFSIEEVAAITTKNSRDVFAC